MNERYLDKNTARLVWAAFGPDARPSEQAAERLFLAVRALVRARAAVVAFPDAAVGILGAMLVLVAIWLSIQLVITGTYALGVPPLLVMAAWLAANLALLPVASVVILLRRPLG